MVKGILTVALAAAMLLTGVSCAKRQLVKLDAEDLMGRGQRYYQQQKYGKAAADFREVVFNYSGTRVAAEASYLAAECSYQLKDYEAAAEEYQQMLGDYPTSDHAAEGQIRLAESYFGESPNYALDQSETGDRALAAIEKFFEQYPESKLAERAQAVKVAIEEKLARKEFEAARFYVKRKQYLSAKIYLEGILREYPATKWAPQARALLAALPAIKARPAFSDTTTAVAPATPAAPPSPETPTAPALPRSLSPHPATPAVADTAAPRK
jgi:outer membrane protein assembly factor BamD